MTGALKAGYSAPCRFYPLQSVDTQIVFYFSAPGAKAFVGENVFWPYANKLDLRNARGCGELTRGPRISTDGRPPAPGLDGLHFEGDPRDFRGLGTQPPTMDANLPVPGIDCMSYTECNILQEDGWPILAEDGLPLEAESCCAILQEADGWPILAEDGFPIEPEACGEAVILQQDGDPILAEDGGYILEE